MPFAAISAEVRQLMRYKCSALNNPHIPPDSSTTGKDFSADELSNIVDQFNNSANCESGKGEALEEYTLGYHPTEFDLVVPPANIIKLTNSERADLGTMQHHDLEPPWAYGEADNTRKGQILNRMALTAQFGKDAMPWEIPSESDVPRRWVLANKNKSQLECTSCGSLLIASRRWVLERHQQESCSETREPAICEHCGKNNTELGLAKGHEMSRHSLVCRQDAQRRRNFDQWFPLISLYYDDNETAPGMAPSINISHRCKGKEVGGRTYKKNKQGRIIWKYGPERGKSIELITLYNFVRNCTDPKFCTPVTGEMKDAFIALGFTEGRGYFVNQAEE